MHAEGECALMGREIIDNPGRQRSMKHLKPISARRADAFTNFFNAIWRAWMDFRYEKKNEYAI